MNKLMVGEKLVRTRFRCRSCDSHGIILSACTSLTRLVLEGFCPGCRKGISTTYDLLSLDAALSEESDLDMKSAVIRSVATEIVEGNMPTAGEAS